MMDIAHLHFLVADADTAQRQTLIDMLGRLGATRISVALDGEAALHTIEAPDGPPIDIAIIDLALSGRDGLELIRDITVLNAGTRAIITGACHASLLFSVESLALAYGLDLLGTIPKPLTSGHLEAVLSHYTPPAAPVLERRVLPRFSFAEVGEGLQARQFEPFFQPKIELASGEVKGLEVFARWRHPEHGVVGPAAFIDALEQNHRIDFLDWTMIERSAEQCRVFLDKGLPGAISLNLSAETIGHPDFLRQIGVCTDRHGIAPSMLTFELPESAVLTNDPSFLERLLRLRMMGYGLAVDDYGTGRSNVQQLARVPFSELKIDRSFVDGASRKRSLATVLSSCLGLARSLDRKSCAVGVETRQDWDFLQGLGCTYAQGHHIARPMEAERFPDWLADWRQFF
ncbi:EAL domain-containing response regulator [Massilia violaceinigra]|nr:EAL domain-containing response regulator [Massilia violaceinigra]